MADCTRCNAKCPWSPLTCPYLPTHLHRFFLALVAPFALPCSPMDYADELECESSGVMSVRGTAAGSAQRPPMVARGLPRVASVASGREGAFNCCASDFRAARYTGLVACCLLPNANAVLSPVHLAKLSTLSTTLPRYACRLHV